MRSTDKARFLGVMNALAAAFRVEATEPLLDAYWLALEDLDADVVSAAARRAMQQSQFMPAPSELRRLAGDLPLATRALHAWDSVVRTIGRHGAYLSVDFDDPIVNATVRNLGGWTRLCRTDSDEFDTWTKKEFQRVYVALASSGVSAEAAQYLPGLHEQANAAHFAEIAAPTQVQTGMPPHPRPVVHAPAQRAALAGASGPEPLARLLGRALEGKFNA